VNKFGQIHDLVKSKSCIPKNIWSPIMLVETKNLYIFVKKYWIKQLRKFFIHALQWV